jgi:hypothetical protein
MGLIGFIMITAFIAAFIGIGEHPIKVAEDICTEQGGGFMVHGNTCYQAGCVFNDTVAWKYPVDRCVGWELWL